MSSLSPKISPLDLAHKPTQSPPAPCAAAEKPPVSCAAAEKPPAPSSLRRTRSQASRRSSPRPLQRRTLAAPRCPLQQDGGVPVHRVGDRQLLQLPHPALPR